MGYSPATAIVQSRAHLGKVPPSPSTRDKWTVVRAAVELRDPRWVPLSFRWSQATSKDLVFTAVKDPEDPRAAEAMWLQPISREPKASLSESGRVSGSRLGEEEGRAGLPRLEPQPGWLQGQTCGER